MLKPIKIKFPAENIDGKASIEWKPKNDGICQVLWETGDPNYPPLSIIRRSAGDEATMRYSRQELRKVFIKACKIT